MNAPVRQGIPLKPDRDAHRRAVMRSLGRAALVIGSGALDSTFSPTRFVRERGWDDDELAGLLTRAASTQATTTTAGWAAELAQTAQAFLRTLTPMSAAAQLLGQCLQLNFNGAAYIRLPAIAPGTASFVGEGAPIRVAQLPTTAGPLVTGFKFATITELTREMMESSDAETIIQQSLIDSCAPSLDAALFSTAAAVAGLRPAGILNGVSPITASTSTSKADAMDDDCAALVGAIAPYAGNGSIALICAPAQGTRLALRAQQLPFTVLMSSAVASGTAIAIATNALASVLEPPVIDAAKSVSLHQEDASPQQLVTAGSPAVVAAPQKSMFQTDSVALRLRMPVSWALRAAGAVSYVTATKW